MQILEPPTGEVHTYYDDKEKVHVIRHFLISTKENEAKWRISRKTGHEKVKTFLGKDFMISPELINAPLSVGGGGHYFGKDTREDILQGYGRHSHGKITKLHGPFYYNDGTDDYWYDADNTLTGSKAASALIQHGSNTWTKFAVSPHIWPYAGPDDNITDWEGLGVALVIKGAYGDQAVVTKLCKGEAAACERSLGASRTAGGLCPKEDAEVADFLSSLVSKSASTQSYMPENKEATSTPSPTTNINTEVAKPITTNAVVETNPQNAISSAPKIVTAEEFAASEKEKADLQKQVKQLLDDKRTSELTGLVNNLGGATDEKTVQEFVEKWFKKDVDAKILREFYTDIKNVIAERRKKASEQGEEPEAEDKEDDKEKPVAKAKSKGASLPREPELPREDTSSRAAQVPINKAKLIGEFIMGGS